MNDFYQDSGAPAPGATGASATIRAEFASIEVAFDKMPTLTANASLPVFINTGATGMEAVTAAVARARLSLVPGTNVQAWDADLDAIAALTSAADKLPYSTGAQAWALTALTAFARTLLAAIDAATARSTLGAAAAGANADITQLNALASINGGPLAGLRNRLINGEPRIDQRNSGAAVTPTVNPSYTVDRWAYSFSQASKITLQQVADAPAGLKYSTKITVAAQYAPLAADLFLFRQPIEGQNIVDFGLGTVAPATITVSLWVKGSVAGTYSVWLQNLGPTRVYCGTVAVTTSWARQTVTLVLDTTGAWATDSTAGLLFGIDLGSGSNANVTAGSWQASTSASVRTSGSVTFVNQVAGSTLNITGVQIELGSVATTFEQRPIGLELALCRRYLPAFNSSGTLSLIGSGQAFSTTGAQLRINYDVPARVPATGLTVSASAHVTVNDGVTATAATAVVFSGVQSIYGGCIDVTVAAGLTQFRPYTVYFNNTSGQILFTGCEL